MILFANIQNLFSYERQHENMPPYRHMIVIRRLIFLFIASLLFINYSAIKGESHGLTKHVDYFNFSCPPPLLSLPPSSLSLSLPPSSLSLSLPPSSLSPSSLSLSLSHLLSITFPPLSSPSHQYYHSQW